MKKRAIDLTFEELAMAGRQAAEAAIAESHAAGLSTWGMMADGTFLESRPDGTLASYTKEDAEPVIPGNTGRKKTRGKAAA